MLEDYKESSVHCMKCNEDIGDFSGDNCSKCGYETLESITQWIIKNAKFPLTNGD